MGTITIVGLGPGAVGHLSLETMGLLQNCAQVILRTAVHPTVAELEKQNVKFTSCDDLYEKAASFEEVYNSVVERVLAAAQNGDVVYAVPGSPLVAEKTVVLMRTAAKAQGIKLVIKPSMSFLDLAYVELGIDPIAGLQIIDAQDFAEIASAGQHPLMITQVYSQMVAGDLKIALMDVLPDEYEIYFLRNLGLPDEERRPIKLFELDRQPNIDHLTSAYIPPMAEGAEDTVFEKVDDAEAVPVLLPLARMRTILPRKAKKKAMQRTFCRKQALMISIFSLWQMLCVPCASLAAALGTESRHINLSAAT